MANKITLSDEIELAPDNLKKEGINWFPGHMAKAIREIKEKLRLVDIVIEVRDARVPLASSNRSLDEIFRQKNRLIVLNKTNLADPLKIKIWNEWFKNNKDPFMFVDCFDKSQLKKMLTMARTIVNERKKESNPETHVYKPKIKMMIIGLPNTGKSTIINQLANRNAVKAANKPGQTVVQQWIVIDKDLELLDTPGVMPPKITKEEHGLWLSAINAIPDDIVGEDRPARFLVEYFKSIDSKEFKARYTLETLDLGIDEILDKIAIKRGCLKQKGLPDHERVYKLILIDFRSGALGKCCFGQPPVK